MFSCAKRASRVALSTARGRARRSRTGVSAFIPVARAFSTSLASSATEQALLLKAQGTTGSSPRLEVRYSASIRRTRTLWCMATIGLHVGLALFMGLVFFSSLMILLTGCLFLIPEDVVERADA